MNEEKARQLWKIILEADDYLSPQHNSRCGVSLAINEFNNENKFRLIEQHSFLQKQRIFQRAR